MVRAILLLFLSAAPAFGQFFSLSNLQGRWTGTLNQGILNLRVAIQFDRNGSGKLEILDQQAPSIPLTAVKVDGYHVTFRVDSVGAYYDGIVMNEGNRLDGEWHQGATLPFVLAREGMPPTLRRPQTPQPPFPYAEQNVKFPSLARGIFLDGTLTIPPGPGPFPAVYLITGSGPQDRDETNLGHKPFRVIADYLSRRGVVVLRADDRGTGKSNGDFSSATTRDFADDAAGAVQFLKSREFVNRIGLIGHSEGGIIAPMVASDPALGAKDVNFLVLLAAPGVPGDQVIIEQQMLVSRAMGVPEMLIERNRETEQKILSIARSEEDPELARSKIRAALGDFGSNPLNLLSLRLDEATSPWFRFLINYDPGPALRALKQPVLALDGSLDVQVPAAQNLPAITWELETGANRDYEVVKLAGLNHFFQTAETGSPAEYGQIEETISPVVLNLIGEWISRHATAPERKPVIGGPVKPRSDRK
ncbi:MAG TPA: alpha/beta fold hydrolase [Bryobacteraceae bacterium]|nr:alpha/beta fold hydrolase [Bryobacteraceae bacterium]